MTTTDLLTLVQRAGIVLRADGDRLTYEAPAGTLTPELRDALTMRRSEILALLEPPVVLVHLPGGLVVPRQAVELALNLEARGFRLSLDFKEQIAIEATGTSGQLELADRTSIARWRWHLGAIVSAACEVCA